MNEIELARQAARAAARLRANHGIGPAEGLCPYDLAQKLGLLVQIVAIPNLEGMYSPAVLKVLIGVDRPPGRRRYTCGHEIGHHVFDHGYRIDELDESNSSPKSPEEFLAQRFSGALLMPKLAVDRAFHVRGWAMQKLVPEQFFMIAQEFGVGFRTIITHLSILTQITRSQADELRRASLPDLRYLASGFKVEKDAFCVDRHWNRSTVDVEIGDTLIVPQGTKFEGHCGKLVNDPKLHVLALVPGVAPLYIPDRQLPVMLRVSRRNFVGLARYRFLEESNADE
jgi:Zn-dependent peptidase ImmA (M78 family)